MYCDLPPFRCFFFLSEAKNNILKEDKSTKEGRDFLSTILLLGAFIHAYPFTYKKNLVNLTFLIINIVFYILR